MYLALFLTPWMLMYGLSTIVMNHREHFKEHYGGPLVKWVTEREQPYGGRFSAETDGRAIGWKILEDLGLEGNYNVNPARAGAAKYAIMRTDPLGPRRITYTPAEGKLVIEKQELRAQPFLESLHRRRGYASAFALDDTWGLTVDLTIVAMVFWVASGLWMWWELKKTRRLGALCIIAGAAIFTFFVFAI
jgi:hypothetical protein